jgi:hypothetical protein
VLDLQGFARLKGPLDILELAVRCLWGENFTNILPDDFILRASKLPGAEGVHILNQPLLTDNKDEILSGFSKGPVPLFAFTQSFFGSLTPCKDRYPFSLCSIGSHLLPHVAAFPAKDELASFVPECSKISYNNPDFTPSYLLFKGFYDFCKK